MSMNVNNRNNFSTSFRGVNPEIMRNLSSMPRNYRTTLIENLPVLEKSEFVDLTYNNGKEIVLKII